MCYNVYMEYALPWSLKNPPTHEEVVLLRLCGYTIDYIAPTFFGIKKRAFYYRYPWATGLPKEAEELGKRLGVKYIRLRHCISAYDKMPVSPSRLHLWRQCGLTFWKIQKRSGYDYKQMKKIMKVHSYRLLLLRQPLTYTNARLKRDAFSLVLGLEGRILIDA